LILQRDEAHDEPVSVSSEDEIGHTSDVDSGATHMHPDRPQSIAYGDSADEPQSARRASVEYGETEDNITMSPVEYGEAAENPSTPSLVPDMTEAIQFADHPFGGARFRDAAKGTDNADDLWQSESAALEEAMRLIRERLEDVPDATVPESEELLPVQLSDLVSPTPIASNPFASLGGARLAAPSLVVGGMRRELIESTGGLVDLIIDYQQCCIDGPRDLRSDLTVEPEIKMCPDSDMQIERPTISVSKLRPGASGFNVRVQVLQHLCFLDTGDAGKIVEWLVGDDGGVCILQTREPVADKLFLGIW